MGHVFVVAGDVTKIHSDGWLLPTDANFVISPAFSEAAGVGPGQRLPGHRWNGARVIPFMSAERRAWLGNVGATPRRAPEWFVEVIDEFASAVQAAVTLPEHRPLRLALPVIGTGQGGMSDTQGELYERLIPALYECALARNVDLVLVCWGPVSYSAAQHMRRRYLRQHFEAESQAWALSEPVQQHARRLGHLARESRLVLFLGAGVSLGAGLPGWQELIDRINDSEADPPLPKAALHRFDLRDQARLVEQHLPGRDLQRAVHAQLPEGVVSLEQAQLASLRVREAVTTNFDRMYEEAVAGSEGADRECRLSVLPYRPDERADRWLLKLHGSLDQPGSVVLTREDYLDVPKRHGALFGIVQAMLLTRHMAFVGYSLSDEDFHQVMHEVREAVSPAGSSKFGTVITLFEDKLFGELWSHDLDVVSVHREVDDQRDQRQLTEASRDLTLLLDLIAYEAADLSAHLLDSRFAGMLDDRDRQLAAALRSVNDSLAPYGPDLEQASAARAVDALLRRLGAER